MEQTEERSYLHSLDVIEKTVETAITITRERRKRCNSWVTSDVTRNVPAYFSRVFGIAKSKRAHLDSQNETDIIIIIIMNSGVMTSGGGGGAITG